MPTGAGGGGSVGATGFVYNSVTTAGTNCGVCGSANTLVLIAIPFPAPLKISTLGVDITTADAVNNYDIGFYNSAGTRVAHIGAQTLPATGVKTFSFVGGPIFLLAGMYFFASTGNGTTALIQGNSSVLSPYVNTSFGSSAGGALPATISPPALAPSLNNNVGSFLVY